MKKIGRDQGVFFETPDWLRRLNTGIRNFLTLWQQPKIVAIFFIQRVLFFQTKAYFGTQVPPDPHPDGLKILPKVWRWTLHFVYKMIAKKPKHSTWKLS